MKEKEMVEIDIFRLLIFSSLLGYQNVFFFCSNFHQFVVTVY